MLAERIRIYWDSQNNLDGLRGGEHSDWFCTAARPMIEGDDLGIYAFRPCKELLTVLVLSEERAAQIFEECSGDVNSWSTWKEEGTLTLENMFTWLEHGETADDAIFEPGIQDLIEDEFNMYLHHQRRINNNSNNGWLRTMFHDLTQQVVCQDLGHWMLYVAARPDHNYCLILYPYYAKYAQNYDGTLFRHIDLNIDAFLKNGRGGNAIQGSVSLDHESDKTGCTEVVRGFHRNIRDWWVEVHKRTKRKNRSWRLGGYVQEVKNLYTKVDAAKYGDWSPVPCPRGGVRITRPDIIHGSRASIGPGIRRTILPWYVAVSEDDKTLDVEECDTYADVSKAYMTRTPPQSTSSGLGYHYRAPIMFSASVTIPAPCPVGQAVVCQQPWNDPDVVKQAVELLGEDRDAALKTIRRSRVALLKAFKTAYQKQKEREMTLYKTDSFYR